MAGEAQVIDLAAVGALVLFKLINQWIADLQQRGALTDDQAAQLQAANERDFGSHAYRTDDQVPVSEGGTMPDPADTTPGGGQ